MGSPRPPAALVLADVALEESSRIAPKVPESSTEAIHSWVSHLPQGLTGQSPDAGSVRVTALVPAPSLSWGLVPYSDHDCKGAASPGASRTPAPCVFRLRTSLDALFPFAASDPLGSGRSWDSPFRALSPPAAAARPFGPPSPLDVARPDATTLAMSAIGPGSLRGS